MGTRPRTARFWGPPQVRFEARLPLSGWTRRFLQTGCGATCGTLSVRVSNANGCLPAERGELPLASTDIWSGHWPKAGKSPIADGFNAATKYVATHRRDSLGWGPVEALGTDLVEGIRGIKAKDGSDLIVLGSSTVTPALLEHGFADEVLLIVYPVLLGTGKRFFSDGTPPRELALVNTTASSSGVIISARELHPETRPRIISVNGPQLIAKDFKEFIRVSGMTHVRTSTYYPQSNGKIERLFFA